MSDKKCYIDWMKVLVGCLWAVVIGFASLCTLGFFHLDSKIAMAGEKREACVNELRKEVVASLEKITQTQTASYREIGEIKTLIKAHMRAGE